MISFVMFIALWGMGALITLITHYEVIKYFYLMDNDIMILLTFPFNWQIWWMFNYKRHENKSRRKTWYTWSIDS